MTAHAFYTRRRALTVATATLAITTTSVVMAVSQPAGADGPHRALFVSSEGTEDASGDREHPWSLERLNAEDLGAGDTVTLTGTLTGTVELDTQDSGTGDQPVTITSAADGPAAGIEPSEGAVGVQITGAAHVDLRGLAVTGAGEQAIAVAGGDHLRIERVETTGYPTGVAVTVDPSTGKGSSDLQIDHLTVDESTDSAVTTTGRTDPGGYNHHGLVLTDITGAAVALQSVDGAVVDVTTPADRGRGRVLSVRTENSINVTLTGNPADFLGGEPTAPSTSPSSTGSSPSSAPATTSEQSVTVTSRTGDTSSTPSVSSSTSAASSSTSTSTSASTQAGTWWSGVSGHEQAQGFAAWRGTPLGIVGTWSDGSHVIANQAQGPAWALGPGGQYPTWTGPVDIAVGGPLGGQTWAQGAAGDLDGHWTTVLTTLRDAWGSRDPGNLYIRFAHEMNGNWYDWSVTPDQIANYKKAWTRFRALQRQILPAAHLVWSTNTGTLQNYDVRDLYPGSDQVDLISLDFYNNWPHAQTVDEFNAKITATQTSGGPAGLATWRQFAQQQGKPFAISEWGNAAVNNNGGGGDAPVFFEQLHTWMTQHAGTGPGQLVYEIYFNIPGFKDHYEMWPTNTMHRSAAEYRNLW